MAEGVTRQTRPVGDFAIKAIGRKRRLHEDLYHRVIVLPWWQFFLGVALVFMLVNALFASLYLLQPGSLNGAREGSFADAFFFSVQTLGTIGYGVVSPATLYAHVITVLETLSGLLGFALVTGLTYAKFARPTAKVLFAKRAVVGRRDGVRCLMLRFANERHNSIVEAQCRLVLLLDHRTSEGEVMRTPTPLALIRDTNPFFRLSWTVTHPIDEKSPFFGEDALETLRLRNALLLVTVTGLDETISQTVHARRTYQLDDIVWNARYADVISTEPDGTRVINYNSFHEVKSEASLDVAGAA